MVTLMHQRARRRRLSSAAAGSGREQGAAAGPGGSRGGGGGRHGGAAGGSSRAAGVAGCSSDPEIGGEAGKKRPGKRQIGWGVGRRLGCTGLTRAQRSRMGDAARVLGR